MGSTKMVRTRGGFNQTEKSLDSQVPPCVGYWRAISIKFLQVRGRRRGSPPLREE